MSDLTDRLRGDWNWRQANTENLNDASTMREAADKIDSLESTCRQFIWTEDNPHEYETEMDRLSKANEELKAEIELLRSPWVSVDNRRMPIAGEWCVARDDSTNLRSDIPPYYIFQQHPDQDCVYTDWMSIPPISIGRN